MPCGDRLSASTAKPLSHQLVGQQVLNVDKVADAELGGQQRVVGRLCTPDYRKMPFVKRAQQATAATALLLFDLFQQCLPQRSQHVAPKELGGDHGSRRKLF